MVLINGVGVCMSKRYCVTCFFFPFGTGRGHVFFPSFLSIDMIITSAFCSFSNHVPDINCIWFWHLILQ